MRYRVVLLAAGLGMVVAACGLGRDTIGARAAKPGAVAGGTITIGIGRPASIDPANSFERWGKLVDSLLCEPLIQMDPVTGEPKPAIAESWIVSANGTQITLKLRKGVRFHDGREMTADDVAYSLSRVASEAEGSNVAGLLRPIEGWPEIHGDKEPRNEEQTVSLAGARVAGTAAVQVTLAESRADFYRVFSHPLASPVPRSVVTRDPAGFETKPVCAGPYMLERPWSVRDEEITLVRFPGYYGRNLGYTRGGRGYADRIVLRIVDSATSATIDAGLAAGPVPAGLTPVSGPTPYLEYIGLPLTTPPFDRREVRIALSQVLDRAAIAREVYGDVRTPARGFIPPAVGGHHRKDACAGLAPGAPDVEAARRQLSKAKVDLRDHTISILANPDFRNTKFIAAIEAQWERAFGMRVEQKTMPWNDYLDAATSQAGLPGPFRMGWEAPYPGPDAALAPLFAAAGIGRDNFTRFVDQRFERILERQARRASTDEDLQTHYRQLEDIVCEQMPAIPVVFGGAQYVVRTDRIDTASGKFVDVTGALSVRELFLRSK